MWYLATCVECGDMVQPFRYPDERNWWADAHEEATGHHVKRSVEG